MSNGINKNEAKRKMWDSGKFVMENSVEESVLQPIEFDNETFKKFTMEELSSALDYFKRKLDAVPDNKMKEICNSDKQKLLRNFNEYLQNREYPYEWRWAKIKDDTFFINDIDPTAKIFERMILDRLNIFQERQSNRLAKSLSDIKQKINDYVIKAKESEMMCIGIYLDIKSAYSSLPYKSIIDGLCKLKIPEYLINLIKSYCTDRRVIYKEHEVKVYGGVPAGAVWSHLLWKVATRNILMTKLPKNSELVVYGDDFLLMVKGPELQNILTTINETTEIFRNSVYSVGLKFNEAKNKAVLLTGSVMINKVEIFNDRTEVNIERVIDVGGRDRTIKIGVDVSDVAV